MADYSGFIQTLTPSSSDDNWTMDAIIDEYAEIIKMLVAGEETASAVIAGRIARSSSSAGGQSALIDVQNLHPHSNAASIELIATYVTTQPTLTAGAIIPYTLNAHGGVVVEIQDPNARPQVVGLETVSCRNDVGVSAAEQSSYGITWHEP